MITQYFLNQIHQCTRYVFIVFFGFIFLSTSIIVWGQDNSEGDILISDINFSRFVLFMKPKISFLLHPKANRWLSIIEKNLCWSGAFKLYQPQNSYCRVNTGRIDMQLELDIKKNDESQTLRLVVTDNSGLPLFWETVILKQNKLQESDVMDAVNKITEKLTGLAGVLGTTIAFTFLQPGHKKVIAKSNTHGQNITAISNNGFRNISPRWNLDGTKIIYTRVGQKQSVIYDDLQGRAVALTPPGMKSSGGAWDKDGKSIIVVLNPNSNSDIYSINLQTKTLERLTKNPGIDTAPSIRPDGDYLLFVSDRAGSNEQIYLMYLPTKEIFRSTFTGSRNTNPVWSPDGSLIAFTSSRRGHDQIYIMDIYGENARALTKGPYPSEQPAWSPDGRQIVFASKRKRNGVFKLYTVFLDGKGLRRVTDTPDGFEEKEPTWTQRRF